MTLTAQQASKEQYRLLAREKCLSGSTAHVAMPLALSEPPSVLLGVSEGQAAHLQSLALCRHPETLGYSSQDTDDNPVY